jgi:hypothetical protein
MITYNAHGCCLGRHPSRRDRRTLQVVNYAPSTLDLPPKSARWDKVKAADAWGSDGNNDYGNCVIACAAHLIDSATANESGPQSPRISDGAAVILSREMGALHGYNILDRLNYWRQKGMWGSRLQAYAAVKLHDHDLLHFCINAFGNADIGVNLPDAWRGASSWETGKGIRFRPGSWGAHSVPILGYDEKWLYVCTWGGIVPMSHEAYDEYVDEAYADMLSEWFARDARTPSGFDSTALLSDLAAITGEPVFKPVPLPDPVPVDPIGPPPGPPPAGRGGE